MAFSVVVYLIDLSLQLIFQVKHHNEGGSSLLMPYQRCCCMAGEYIIDVY